MKDQKRAFVFHGIVSPFFKTFINYTLFEFCAGDGKGAIQFDNESNLERIVFVDIKEVNRLKKNTEKIKKPYEFRRDKIERITPSDNSVLMAIHSCGVLTDLILEKAVEFKLPLAVMPCCYTQNMKKYNLKSPPDNRKLLYKAEKDYYDAFRVQFLKENGYKVVLEQINPVITPMNNILIAIP